MGLNNLKAKPSGIKKKQTPKVSQSSHKRSASNLDTQSAPTMADKTRELAPGAFLENGIVHDPRKIILPMMVLRSVHDENAPLEEQIKFMKERHETISNFVAYLIEEEEFMQYAGEWAHAMPGQWSKEWQFLFHYARGFAANWAYHDPPENTLTQAQKERLVASLDGYCVQEKFDDIVSLINSRQRKYILETFAATFLMKTVVEKFFQHPFWYAEVIPKGAEGQCEEPMWEGVSPDGAVLERILARFEEVDPVYARIWRNVTARLFNTMYEAKDVTFGKTLQARRRAKCHSLAKEILADETFLCLLKPTDDPAERESALGWALAGMSDVIVPMLSQDPTLKFRTIHDLESHFHHASKSLEADFDHGFDSDEINTRLDGHRVLIIQHPFVVYIWSTNPDKEEHVVSKAPALMEDDVLPRHAS